MFGLERKGDTAPRRAGGERAAPRWIRRGAAAVLALFPLAAGACDPCSGTSACTGGEWLAYSGEIYFQEVNLPVAGGEVLFVRRSGPELPDTVRAAIDARGIFELNAPAGSAGEVTGDLVIRPAPPFGPYTVRGARVFTSPRRDVRSLGRFPVTPAFVDATLTLYLRGNNRPIAGEFVAVRRVGGISTTANDTVLATGPDGSIRIRAVADGPGDVEWEATVIPAGDRSRPLGSVRFTTPTLGRRGDETPSFRLGIGPHLGYNGLITFRDQRPVEGVRVTFRRTSGLPLVSDTSSWVTDRFGYFAIDIRPVNPLVEGEVVGDLHFALPAPYAPFNVPGLGLRTFFNDERRLAGHFYVPAP